MAAVNPYIGAQYEEIEAEVEKYDDAGGLGALSGARLGMPDLQRQHAGLLAYVWSRQAAYAAMQRLGLTINIERIGKKYFVATDKKIDPFVIPWNPAGEVSVDRQEATGNRRAGLLSWTSKMNAPSFSLPAGSPLVGGSCPGAHAAQSVVPAETRKGLVATVSAELQRAQSGHTVRLDRAICQMCYAQGSNYAMGNNIVASMLRLSWAAQSTVTQRDGHFQQVMIAAINVADYHVDSIDDRHNLRTNAGQLIMLPPGTRYFRIHDSGDFFHALYFDAWCDIARAFDGTDGNPPIMFWAPTRIWVLPAFQKHIANAHKRGCVPWNLILRPSSYHVGDACPVVPGWPWAGSGCMLARTDAARMSIDGELLDKGMTPEKEHMVNTPVHTAERGGPDKRYSWRCQAYDASEATCRSAVAPDGKQGCRACWVDANERVQYSLH